MNKRIQDKLHILFFFKKDFICLRLVLGKQQNWEGTEIFHIPAAPLHA